MDIVDDDGFCVVTKGEATDVDTILDDEIKRSFDYVLAEYLKAKTRCFSLRAHYHSLYFPFLNLGHEEDA
ncbi:hypothetical protein FXO37_06611 [Capsicum annuum]|nr:hypothetical protein FXO37_06611 [Capsicum annuum]